MNSLKPFIYVLIGMLCGGLIGFFVFFNMDNTKGWNPYGWWFVATFVLTILGGLAGIFIYGSCNKPSKLKHNSY